MKIVLLGAPGAGKGTYASRLKDKYNLSHISTGELLRNAIKEETKSGLQAKELIDQGKFVPDEMIRDLLKEKLETIETGVLLDGFPRTLIQAEMLKEIADIKAVIKFDVEEETILKRLANRRTCRDCGGIFHTINVIPKKDGICDHCEGELYQRDDDKEETILERLKTYEEQTAPLENFYKELGILKNVDANIGINDPNATIIQDCQKILDEVKESL